MQVSDMKAASGGLTAISMEQFLNTDGTVYYDYLATFVSGSKPSIIQGVFDTFGVHTFPKVKNTNEVTLEEFQFHYEFAKFPSARTWISEMYNLTGKLLTREKLFEYLSKSDGSVFQNRNSVPKRRNCVFN